MSWLNEEKKKSAMGLEVQLCLERWMGLKITPLTTKVRLLISNLERSTDLKDLLKAGSITVLSVSWDNDK